MSRIRGLRSLSRVGMNPKRKITHHEPNLVTVGLQSLFKDRVHCSAGRTLEIGKLDYGYGRTRITKTWIIVGTDRYHWRLGLCKQHADVSPFAKSVVHCLL